MTKFEALIDEVRQEYLELKKQAGLAETFAKFTPIDAIGPLIREQRRAQNLTLHDLCDLSGVAYATLSKLESGNPSARLDSLQKVLSALGLALYAG